MKNAEQVVGAAELFACPSKREENEVSRRERNNATMAGWRRKRKSKLF